MNAGTLSILGNGGILSGTSGTGNAGSVSVSVAGLLSIDGNLSTVVSGIASDSERGGTGNAGVVTVTAGTLSIVNTGQISSNTFGIGSGGSVSVTVPGRLSIGGTPGQSPTGMFADSNSSAANSGDAGTVTVSAGDLVIAGNGGRISSNTSGSGKAGRVIVGARSLSVVNSGAISSSTFGLGSGGNVSVTAGSLSIAGSGDISSTSSGFGRAGSVSVDVTGSQPGALTILTNGSVRASISGAGDAGSVAVRVAGGLTIDGTGAELDVLTGISSQANPGSTGKAGDVTVSAGNLSIINNGVISGITYGIGAGGNVTVNVAGNLMINGIANPFFTGILAKTFDLNGGNAGRVNVAADNISILNRGLISTSTFGRGAAGEVAVNASGELVIDGAGTPGFGTGIGSNANEGTGNAGRVAVTAGSLSLTGGGEIQSLTATSGNGGDVQVTAQGPLMVSNPGSGIIASATSTATGNAGSVMVRAPQIVITDGAEIASTTAGKGEGGSVSVTTPGALVLDGAGVANTQIAASAIGPQSGSGGSVTVSADSLTVKGGALIASSTAGPGTGGNVDVTAASDIVLPDPGPQITAQSTGSGDAGSITVWATRLLMNDRAAISTEAETSTANGGNITLHLRDFLYLVSSEISTSVKGETGNGGNITIDPPLIILDHSRIKADAIVGHGGNIKITADPLILSSDSSIEATSERGVSGTVVINGLVNANGALVILSSQLRGRTEVLREACAPRADRPQSSLVEAGRGGLPQDPEATLPALYLAGRDLADKPRGTVASGPATAHPTTAHVTMHCGEG